MMASSLDVDSMMSSSVYAATNQDHNNSLEEDTKTNPGVCLTNQSISVALPGPKRKRGYKLPATKQADLFPQEESVREKRARVL